MKALLAALLLLIAPVQADTLLTGAGHAPSGGGGGYAGPGDVQASALAWWGLRAYSTAKRGTAAINACLPLDATCGDMLTDGTTGNLVLGTLGGVACNNSTQVCTIKTFYDQSGANSCAAAACNLTQATIATRPTLLVTAQGSYTAQATAAGAACSTAATFLSQAMPYTFSMVGERTGSFGAFNWAYGNVFAGVAAGWTGTASTFFMYDSASVPTATAADSAYHAFQLQYDNAGVGSQAYIDGAATAMNLGATQALGTSAFSIFAQAGCGSPLTGNILELGLWAGNFSGAVNTSMNSNQHTYGGF